MLPIPRERSGGGSDVRDEVQAVLSNVYVYV